AKGSNNTEAPTESASWTVELDSLTETNPGTYYIWYKVTGDSNHNSLDPVCIEACIAKANIKKAAWSALDSVSFNYTKGTSHSPIVKVVDTRTTLVLTKGTHYSLTGTLQAEDEGVYTIKVNGIGDYYTGVTELVWKIVDPDEDVKSQKTESVEYTVGSGNNSESVTGSVKGEINTEDDALETSVSNITDADVIEGLLTEGDEGAIKALGSSGSFSLDVILNVDDEDPEDSEKAKVKALLPSSTDENTEYVDLSLFKLLILKPSGASEEQQLTTVSECGTPLKLIVAVPAKFLKVSSGKSRIFYVVRIHDGKAEIIASVSQADIQNNQIPFSSDLFSTFAITYSDVAAGTEKSEIIKADMLQNRKTDKGTVAIGTTGATLNYYQKIPFFGKKVNKKNLEDLLGEMTVSKDGIIYEVENVKVQAVAVSDNGTILNVQITKIEPESGTVDKKTLKALQKEIKNATKWKKKQDGTTAKIALLAYSLNLETALSGAEVNITNCKLTGKTEKDNLKFACKLNDKKVNLKNGKKDTWKLATNTVKYDKTKKELTITGADMHGTISGNLIDKVDASKVK
ncbi:MAG: hypothetical protein K5989_04225, partial [Lachnospiraceae bacterium]|nr:hypothetical protein [Lachnospiraceae bacterium]